MRVILVLASFCLVFCVIFSHVIFNQNNQPSTLESAILPPVSFRRWFVGQGRSLFKDQGRSTIPMDRFAGHGAWSNPTDMPGYYEKEQSLVRSKFGPKVTDLNTDIASIDKDLKNSSLSTTWPELKKRKVEDMTQLKKIYSEWFSTDVQKKVQEMNKDMVIGRARHWNKDKFLGGSDHFVTLDQAEKQLDGGGYGHRYSITDWLSGD